MPYLAENFGAEGIIVKIGETLNGVPTIDDNFVEHINATVAAGLPYGIYYVSHAIDGDKLMEEAQWINDMMANYLNGEVPELGVWWDMEVYNVKRMSISQELLDTIGTMQAWWHGCQKIGIYAQYSYFIDYIDLEKYAQYQIPIWVAQYCYPENSLMTEYPNLHHVAWQWTTHGENTGEEPLDEYGNAQDENEWYGF